MKSYIEIPQFTTLEDIRKRDYTLSASQYKTFCIKNQSTKTVADFLERGLERSDLGVEVGSEAYQFVPVQDFSISWTDEALYAKYRLTEEEIAFIESMIKPME